MILAVTRTRPSRKEIAYAASFIIDARLSLGNCVFPNYGKERVCVMNVLWLRSCGAVGSAN